MNKYLKQITFDVVILPCLFISVFYSRFSVDIVSGAENIISFYGVFNLIIGIGVLLIGADNMASKMKDSDIFKKGSFGNYVQILTCLIEILITAYLGWYWVCSGIVVRLVATQLIKDKIEEI